MKKTRTLNFASEGFSLIELMIVVAIASLMTYMLVGTFYKAETRESEVYNAARDLGAYVKKYRMQSINENTCYLFSFTTSLTSPSTNKYEIYENSGCDGTIAGTVLKSVPLTNYKFDVMFGNYGGTTCTSKGVGISGSCGTTFYFKPRGFLDQTTDVSIYFTTKDDYDSGNKDIQVRTRIDSLTGRVDLEKYAQDPW